MYTLGRPRLKSRLEGGGVVDFGVVEHGHRGSGAGGRPRLKRADDKGRVQRPLAGGVCNSLVAAL